MTPYKIANYRGRQTGERVNLLARPAAVCLGQCVLRRVAARIKRQIVYSSWCYRTLCLSRGIDRTAPAQEANAVCKDGTSIPRGKKQNKIPPAISF